MAAAREKELKEIKTKQQQTQQELDRTQSKLHNLRGELKRSQSQLDEVLGELKQTHFELHQLKEKGEDKDSKLNAEVKKELEETKSQLKQTEALLKQYESQLEQAVEMLENFHYKESQVAREQEKFKAQYTAHVTKNLLNILLPTIQQADSSFHNNNEEFTKQNQRIASVAEYCARGWGGDLIEISARLGETTEKLAAVALKYNRRLISVVLQSDTKNQNKRQGQELVRETIQEYQDIIDFIQLSEGNKITKDFLKGRKLCFTLLTSLGSYELGLEKIKAASNFEGIIALQGKCLNDSILADNFTSQSKLCLPLIEEIYLLNLL